MKIQEIIQKPCEEEVEFSLDESTFTAMVLAHYDGRALVGLSLEDLETLTRLSVLGFALVDLEDHTDNGGDRDGGGDSGGGGDDNGGDRDDYSDKDSPINGILPHLLYALLGGSAAGGVAIVVRKKKVDSGGTRKVPKDTSKPAKNTRTITLEDFEF